MSVAVTRSDQIHAPLTWHHSELHSGALHLLKGGLPVDGIKVDVAFKVPAGYTLKKVKIFVLKNKSLPRSDIYCSFKKTRGRRGLLFHRLKMALFLSQCDSRL